MRYSSKDWTNQSSPFAKSYKLEDCSWVSSRWCEILAMSMPEKQRMLELDSPLVRLELVQDWINEGLSTSQGGDR